MMASARIPVYLLLSLALVPIAGSVIGRDVEELLPPAVRHAEKRSLLSDNERQQRYNNGRGFAGAAFSPDGKLLMSGFAWWDVRTGRNLGQSIVQHNYNENASLAFTPDAKQVVMASWGGHQGVHPVSVWDAATRGRVRSLDDDVNDTPFTAVAVAPDGKTIAFGGGVSQRQGGTPQIVLWDLASGDEVGRLDALPVAPQPHGQAAVYQALAYSPDGRTLAALLDGRVVLIEVATGKPRGEMAVPVAPQQLQNNQVPPSGALAFSPDGRTLAVGTSDGAILRFDLLAGLESTPLPGHNSSVVALCWTPDGKKILSYSLDGSLYAWRTSSGREWSPKPGPLTPEDLEGLWDVLRGDDARDLFGCVRTLAANPDQAMPFLRKHLPPAPRGDEQLAERLVNDLQKDYNSRKRAVVQLRKIGQPAAHALQQAMQRGTNDNLMQRMYYELINAPPPADEARALRVLRVLERIGSPDAGKLLKELAEGAPTATLTIQAKAALARLPKAEPKKPELTADALWEALAGLDSVVAQRAIRALVGRPSAVVQLRDGLKEIAAKGEFDDDPKRVEKLIGDLDNEDFPAREGATKDLRSLGRMVVPSLRKALQKKVSAELKSRLEKLIEEAAKGSPPEMLRVGRALEALELMGTAEARQALEALAKEAKGAWLRQAVAESLQRQRLAGR